MDIGMLSSGVPPYTLENAIALIERAKRDGPVRVDWQGRNRDGGVHWDEVSIKLVKIGGVERILAVTRDVTERRRAEEERVRLEGQLRQAQKMEAIGQLAGGIAHDFNNILTAILGYLVMAMERAEGIGDPKLVKYLDRAERSGERAKALIQEMLTFSRGQRGEPRSLQLGPRLVDAVKLLQSSLPSSIEIRTELAPGRPLRAARPIARGAGPHEPLHQCPRRHGRQGILLISLSTATPSVCVCSSCPSACRAGSYVELAVTDSGPGIEPRVLERMFEPFFSTKEVGQGSGMGLAMVHGIVHEYGGHVQVDTGAAEGTTMRVWFPAWFAPERLRRHRRPRRVRAAVIRRTRVISRGRALLAEDESAVREFMGDLLGSWGLSVTLAENGVEACEQLAEDPDGFDLIGARPDRCRG